MNYFFRFDYPFALLIFIPLIVAAIMYTYYARGPYFTFTFADTIKKAGLTVAPTYKKILFSMRILVIIALLWCCARPQLVDPTSNAIIDGIDIILALDVSGSMQFQDFEDDPRSRLDIAKSEALHFVKKRTHDALGLVIFANDALSYMPLTLDKTMISSTINGLTLGIIDADGTVLVRGLLTAINRLKSSQAKSKIVILLTDGTPSPTDLHPNAAVEIAQKLGIKIYTIGIGSDQDRFFIDPQHGPVGIARVNTELLNYIALNTGGASFLARNASDMREIYDTIDRLEKSSHTTCMYHRLYDLFIPAVIVAILLLTAELVLTSTIWFGI